MGQALSFVGVRSQIQRHSAHVSLSGEPDLEHNRQALMDVVAKCMSEMISVKERGKSISFPDIRGQGKESATKAVASTFKPGRGARVEMGAQPSYILSLLPLFTYAAFSPSFSHVGPGSCIHTAAGSRMTVRRLELICSGGAASGQSVSLVRQSPKPVEQDRRGNSPSQA